MADDDRYGRAPATPFRVGGSTIDGEARERAVIEALRGPNGEGMQGVFTSLTTWRGGIIRIYEVTIAGRAPIQLYFDTNRSEPLKAPRGFICAASLDGIGRD